MQNSRVPAALSYLARGWSVIPLCPHDHEGVPNDHKQKCKSPGKAPLWPWKDYQERLPKENEIKFFWKRNPNCNVGVAMGPVSGLIGLDIDGQAGMDLMTKLSGGEIPETLEFSTPGGGHRILFRWPGFEVKIKSLKAPDGHEAIRILSEGSQTVFPPSIHPSGGEYTWCHGHQPNEIQAADCPPWLIKLLKEGTEGESQKAQPSAAPNPTQPATLTLPQGPLTPYERARSYIDKCDPAISGQGGHNQTFKVAVKLVKGFGVNNAEALYLLTHYYNPRCQPPWSDKELQHKVDEAEKSPGPVGYLLTDKAPQPVKNSPAPKTASGGEEALTRKFKDVQPKPIEWLWPKWIPLGKLAILDGDPGLGKSTMLIDIAARVSTSGVMPDNSHGVSGHVILMSAEDAPEDTIRPRLEAAQANLDRVHDLSFIHKKGEDQPPEIPADLPFIEDKIATLGVKLLVIDPLMAFLYGADANKDQEIRRVLFKLSRIAEKHKCAIICMRHLNKGGSGKAIYRGNSSIGVIGHARTGLLVAADPDDENLRVLAVSKCNLAAKPKSLNFSLEPIGDVCRIGWAGSSNHSADDLVAPPPTGEQKEKAEETESKVQQAQTILQYLMEESEGAIEIKAARAECHAAGLSLRSVERAIKKLGWTVNYKIDDLGKRSYFWVDIAKKQPEPPPAPTLYSEEVA